MQILPPSLVDVFAALGDATRLRIVNLLLAERELCVCDIQSVLDAPQSKTSRHLAYLRRTGLVSARRADQWMYYSIPASSPLRSTAQPFLEQLLRGDAQLTDDAKRLRKLRVAGACKVGTSTVSAPISITVRKRRA